MDGEPTLFDGIAASELAIFLRESAWAYPVLETFHIVGIALVLGGILLLDLRLLGLNRVISFSALSRHVIPWVITGIVGNAITGTLLFISDAAEFASNVSLRAKLVLIQPAGESIIEEVDVIAAQMRDEVLAGVSDQDLATALRVLDMAVAALEPENAHPVRARRPATANFRLINR